MKTQTKTETCYTIADLLALGNDALNSLAAELRGWTLSRSKIFWRDSDGEVVCHRASFTPATDRNQSGELLRHAAKQDADILVWTGNDRNDIDCTINQTHWFQISGNDARAETIAFCAAMLAMEGRLR